MRFTALILAATAIAGVTAAQAQVAYTNGPVNANIGGYGICCGQAVANSFTLSSTTTVTGFTFGGWTFAGETIQSVDFGISSALDYATPNTASLTASGLFGGGYGSYDVREYSASITPLTLAAGTYWFTLANSIVPSSDTAFWDQNNGPSQAYVNGYSIASGSFSILSGSGPVPEPASWAMMVGGFGLVGGALRSRRKAAVSFA